MGKLKYQLSHKLRHKKPIRVAPRKIDLKVQALLREKERYESFLIQEPVLACDRYAELEKNCPKGPIRRKVRPEQLLISVEQANLFYLSSDWIKLRNFTLQKYGRNCMCCGTTTGKICVDHIKPLRRFWELRLIFENLQILCEFCNLIKGNWTIKDFRRTNPKRRKRYLRKATFYEERLTQYALKKLEDG